jgi:polyisoprenoid-binding protein YceI
MRLLKIALAAVVAVAALVGAGTFAYIHFIQDDPPAKLTLRTDTSSTTAGTTATGPATIEGTWKATTSGSQVGYRVNEVLFGQRTTAVGRTSKVRGSLTVAGTTVTAADVTADLTTVTSSESRRDGQFQGRIMDTARYPTATFTLTAPIQLGSVPAAGQVVTETATGTLNLHGTTKTVTVALSAKWNGSGTIEVNGEIPIAFADYGIPNPSFGTISTEDHGLLELLVAFTKAQ